MDALSGTTPPAATATRKTARRLLALSGVLMVVFGTVVLAGFANASVGEWIATNIIGPIILLLVGFVGQLLLIMVSVLISIAKYNDFVNSTAVANGWVIVRDVTNMFFILVLLVLAFGTMLGVESYSYKNRMLPRLLIMAVVINFSRTICGLLIDFGQVVMLTFVNGFAAAAGGNFVEALKIKELMEPGERRGGVDGWSLVVAALLALAIVTISLGVVIIMTATLVIRIIYLWLLVILSPIAFFMKAVPGGKASGYYAEWWSMFTSNIITGPILAFFLWLSLVSVASGGVTKNFPDPTSGENVDNDSVTKAFEHANIQGYIISIGLLLGGVMMAQKAGGAGVGIGKSIATGAGKAVARGAKTLGKGAWDRTGGRAVDYAKEKAYTAGTYVPGLKTAAGRRLGELRQDKAGKAAEASKFISQLKPEEAARYAKSRVPLALMSNEQKAIQKEALRSSLKANAGKVTGEGANDFRDQMATFQKLGAATNDKSVVGDLGEIQKSRPDLIVDPRASGEARTSQEAAFSRVVGGMSARDVGKLSTSAMTSDVLANMNPKVLQKALESSDTGSAQRKALEAYANKGNPNLSADMAKATTSEQKADIMQSAFRAQQDEDKKKRPDLIGDQDERNRVVGGMTDKEIGALAPEMLSTGVVAALASANKLDKIDMSSVKLDAGALGKDNEMAGKIAIAMGDKMKDMPKDIAQALRTGLKESKSATSEQKLAAGLPVQDVFKSFNAKTSTFGDPKERGQYEAMIQKMGASAALRGASATTLADRGGVNDQALALFKKLDDKGKGIAALAQDKPPKTDQILAAIQAAKGLAKADVAKETAAYEKRLPKDLDPAARQAAAKKFSSDLTDAATKATMILQRWKNDKSTLGAAAKDIRFTVASKVAKGAAVGAVVAVAPGAVAAGAALAAAGAGVGKLYQKRGDLKRALQAGVEGVSQAAGAVSRETGRAKRKITRAVQK